MHRSIARLLVFAGLLALSPTVFAQGNQPADPMGMMSPALSVEAQESQGYSVVIGSATLKDDGFIVVHAFDENGDLVLTPPLGVSYQPAGEHDNVSIALDAGLLAEYGYGAGSKNVLPMLHIDANANQTYEFPNGPDVPVMVDGQMVVAELPLTLGPALHVFDQTLANSTVVIDATTLTQDGFVVVHAFDTDGELVLTPPLGVVHLKAGLHRYVAVPLDGDLLKSYGYDEAGAKDVLPMVHVDANGNGAYEFPDGPDVPVMVDGAMVTAKISLSDAVAVTPSVDVTGAIKLDVSGQGLSVTVPAVTLAQPGFVVLHSVDEDGELVVTPVIGSSEYLASGQHENVTIWLNGTDVPAVGDTVYAMLHTDDGDGMYSFPMSDPPVTTAAGIVMQPFDLH